MHSEVEPFRSRFLQVIPSVRLPRCAAAGTSSVVPAVRVASPLGYEDPNQYWKPREEQTTQLQLDSTSLSIPLLVRNQHPGSPEDGKPAHMHVSTAEPWPLTFDPWPFCLMAYRLRLARPGNCCLVITSRVVFGSEGSFGQKISNRNVNHIKETLNFLL